MKKVVGVAGLFGILNVSVYAAGNEFLDTPLSIRWLYWTVALLPLVGGVLSFMRFRTRGKNIFVSAGLALLTLITIAVLGFPLGNLEIVSGILSHSKEFNDSRLWDLVASMMIQIVVVWFLCKRAPKSDRVVDP